MKNAKLETLRNLLILVIVLLILGIAFALYKHDIEHWYKYFFSLGVLLIVGIVMSIVGLIITLAFKAAWLFLMLFLNKLASGKVEYFADYAEHYKTTKEKYKKIDERDVRIYNWIINKFSLKKTKAPNIDLPDYQNPEWWGGLCNGRSIWFHDSNPYHCEIYFGSISGDAPVKLKRIYKNEPMPSGACRLSDSIGKDGAGLDDKFYLLSPPSGDFDIAKLTGPDLMEAILKLSESVFVLSLYDAGIAIMAGKVAATPETMNADITAATSILTALGNKKR